MLKLLRAKISRIKVCSITKTGSLPSHTIVIVYSRAYSEHCQLSKMELSAKIVKDYTFGRVLNTAISFLSFW